MNDKVVLVVEGTSDVQRLQTLIDADYIVCNGSSIDQETIECIKELSKVRKVIIFTDPDYPGEQIRNKIAAQVENVYHAFVDRKLASNGKKLGIAECQKEEILRALKDYVKFTKSNENKITMKDFMELGLTGQNDSYILREKLSKKLSLGHGSAKTILKRVNMLGLSLEKIKEAINDL